MTCTPSCDLRHSFSAIYPDLRAAARARLRSRRDTFLGPTALVHEAYIRLAEAGRVAGEQVPEFLLYASRTMRNIIIDSMRRRDASRHGGDIARVELDHNVAGAASGGEEAMAVHQALARLETLDARLARVVEMRYFAGMTDVEIARALGVNERTVRREWHKARMLLAQAFGRE